jgi:hypothetical protein
MTPDRPVRPLPVRPRGWAKLADRTRVKRPAGQQAHYPRYWMFVT